MCDLQAMHMPAHGAKFKQISFTRVAYARMLPGVNVVNLFMHQGIVTRDTL
jgi:hypothetical protein